MSNLIKSAVTTSLFLTIFSAHALVLGVTEGVTYRASDAEIEAKFVPIAKAISTATKQPVKIMIISSYNGLRDALKQGTLDIAFIHPTHVALEAVKAGSYKTAALTAGFTDYKVSFLCNEPQPIKTWTTVNGKGVVTPDADSITAVMTRAMLRENGIASAAVKMQVTRFQDAVPFYVDSGFAAYGATASKGVVKAWSEKGGKTCAESRPMPIKYWIANSKLDTTTLNTVKDTLLGMDKSDVGNKALTSSGYKGFVAPNEATDKTLTTWLGI